MLTYIEYVAMNKLSTDFYRKNIIIEAQRGYLPTHYLIIEFSISLCVILYTRKLCF